MKKPKLIPNAGKVLRHSWTSHILIIGGLLTAAEAVLPYLAGTSFIPPNVFPFVAFAIVFAAFIARYLLQGVFHDDC
ncbi:hypothetical protein [Pleomorphomonas oryzae]|uniref:DUF7940 domain-containing protein n=1 Tax=Pleomorphomonas oryzae TaxID=261934 RepID=UPI0004222387|nr:hypothetical protein [Pleomorphomonas oryzae]